MKSLTLFWKVVAHDMATKCYASADLDIKKVEMRVESEGMSFFTITLPTFDKGLTKALSQGFVEPQLFPGFAWRNGLPLFLKGFLVRIFDAKNGKLLDEPCTDSIFAIRQLCCMYGKIQLECTPTRQLAAVHKFVQCEQEIEEAEKDISPELRKEFRRAALLLFGNVNSEMDRLIYTGDLLPKHGPGATADRLSGNEKFDQNKWPTRMERVFPFGEYALPNWRYYNQLDHVDFLEPLDEQPVKVTLVEKTLKTPRIIAIEPTCMQYMQQAILKPLVRVLESEYVGHVRGNTNNAFRLLGFSDQDPNRQLAKSGSIQGHLATLDLSEASDRVSKRHVEDLLSCSPSFLEGVMAVRSTKAVVPLIDEIISLKKYASMGSALCFPMEAMVFLTAVVVGVSRALSKPVSSQMIDNLRGFVRIYGDDIIVPVDYVDEVILTLEALGLKVNKDKSFWTGKFRESCGGDYYDGVDVTPIRVRRLFPSSLKDVSEVISLVELRNHMYLSGMWEPARYLDKEIYAIMRHFPIVEDTSPALGRTSLFFPPQGEKECPRLHRPLVRSYKVLAKPPASQASGIGSLVKCLTKEGDEPFMDPKHLRYQGRDRSVKLISGWMPVR